MSAPRGQLVGADRLWSLIGLAVEADTPADIARVMHENPELSAPGTAAMLRAVVTPDPYLRERLEATAHLLRWAVTDPTAALIIYRGHSIELRETTLARMTQASRIDAGSGIDHEAMIAVTTSEIAFARMLGLTGLLRVALLARADAHLIVESGAGAAQFRAAAEDYGEALALTTEDDELSPALLSNYAAALAGQENGNLAPRLAEAAVLLRRAIAHPDMEADPRLLALLQTNLANMLTRSAGPANVERLEEALALCDEALTYRSLTRGADDWAYTMISHGAVVQRLHALGKAREMSAAEDYQAVMDQAGRVSGRLVAAAADRLLQWMFSALGNLRDDPDFETSRAATEGLAGQLAVDANASPGSRGRALSRLGRLLWEQGDHHRARMALGFAMQLLADEDLDEFRTAARALATFESSQGRWLEAAQAYRSAVEIADRVRSEAVTRTDALQHAQHDARLHRWAAFGFARAGEVETALLTLEFSRALPLRAQLAAEHLPAPSGLAGAAVGDPATGADGLDRAPGPGTVPDIGEIRAAAQEGIPVVYVNPTPEGTLLLRVPATGAITSSFLPVTSGEIVLWILYGAGSDPDAPPVEPRSYMFAAGSIPDGPEEYLIADLGLVLDRLLPWVGTHVASGIAELLSRGEDRGILLVGCGPLATVPIAAAPFGSPPHCLLDDFSVATTPAAGIMPTLRRRADSASDLMRCLVAAADPGDDLMFARAEASAVAAHFTTAHVGTGEEASKAWLRRELPGATAVHLACRGFSTIIDARVGGLVLSDGVLTGAEIPGLDAPIARLVVLSGCQTGVSEYMDVENEAFSVGTAWLAAGAAGAIVSLWKVDDLATAMLMTRLYEELAAGLVPAEALAASQRWLRTVTREWRAAFIETCRSHLTEADYAEVIGEEVDELPFAHPRFWAGFAALGA